jgi:hypothetical protein
MEAAESAFKLGIGKIGTPDPGVEIFESQIYRIRPFSYGGVQGLRMSHRSKEFDRLHEVL